MNVVSLEAPIGALIPVMPYSGYTIPKNYKRLVLGDNEINEPKSDFDGVTITISPQGDNSVFVGSTSNSLANYSSATTKTFKLTEGEIPLIKFDIDETTTTADKHDSSTELVSSAGNIINTMKSSSGKVTTAATDSVSAADSTRKVATNTGTVDSDVKNAQSGTSLRMIHITSSTISDWNFGKVRHSHKVSVNHAHTLTTGSYEKTFTATDIKVGPSSVANQTAISLAANYKIRGMMWLLRLY